MSSIDDMSHRVGGGGEVSRGGGGGHSGGQDYSPPTYNSLRVEHSTQGGSDAQKQRGGATQPSFIRFAFLCLIIYI